MKYFYHELTIIIVRLRLSLLRYFCYCQTTTLELTRLMLIVFPNSFTGLNYCFFIIFFLDFNDLFKIIIAIFVDLQNNKMAMVLFTTKILKPLFGLMRPKITDISNLK